MVSSFISVLHIFFLLFVFLLSSLICPFLLSACFFFPFFWGGGTFISLFRPIRSYLCLCFFQSVLIWFVSLFDSLPAYFLAVFFGPFLYFNLFAWINALSCLWTRQGTKVSLCCSHNYFQSFSTHFGLLTTWILSPLMAIHCSKNELKVSIYSELFAYA